MNKGKNGPKESSLKGYAKYYMLILFIMYALSMLGVLLLAWILYKFHVSEKVLSIGVVVIYTVVNFIGGLLIGKKIGRQKFLWGLLAGGLYYFILVIVSNVCGQYVGLLSTKGITAFLICVGAAMLGGMFG